MYPLTDQLAAGLHLKEYRILVFKETNMPQQTTTSTLAPHERFRFQSCSRTQTQMTLQAPA